MNLLPDRQPIETTSSMAGTSILSHKESVEVRETHGESPGPPLGRDGVMTDVTVRG